MIEVVAAGITDVGRMRKANEDAYYIDEDRKVYVVADGMGGHKAGEVASRIVVETLQDKMARDETDSDGNSLITYEAELTPEATRLMAGIHLANQAVFSLSDSNKAYKGMGSTVSAILLTDTRIISANVGDSPIFLIRNDVIEEIYTPHTYIAEHAKLAPKGSKPLGEQYAHMITRAVGLKPVVQPDVFEIMGLQGDKILICSDGLSDLVKPEEIKKVVDKHDTDKAVEALVAFANQRGGRDNITIILIHIVNHPNAVGAESASPAIREKENEECLPQDQPFPVDYDTNEASHSTVMYGLCETGGFIKTTNAFAIGDELDLTFVAHESGDTFVLSGIVEERRVDGIQIKFEDLSEKQVAKLKTAIEHNK